MIIQFLIFPRFYFPLDTNLPNDSLNNYIRYDSVALSNITINTTGSGNATGSYTIPDGYKFLLAIGAYTGANGFHFAGVNYSVSGKIVTLTATMYNAHNASLSGRPAVYVFCIKDV